ncbi:M20 family metallopeptidase [Alteribacter aurantiacus]|uniref:M20 family metallopeptidase n=1 Tax=Alteribacter aurantiacus TaxID=254410 RepID=UPI000426B57D|nr:M20 family metallopeptidase [Alteribacter aurantiacus]
MSVYLDYLTSYAVEQERDLLQLLRAESPTYRKELVDKCSGILMKMFEKHLGATSVVYPQLKRGDHFRVKVGKGRKRILILVHVDTVWDQGRLVTYKKDGKIFGPGAMDMKGGIVQGIWAVKALKACGGLQGKEVVFLCTSDEEVGSQTSKSIIESEAKKSQVVLVLEPPVSETGAIKTSRSGIGLYDYYIKGRGAHAGIDHEKGVSAVKELAHQILKLEELTDYRRGTTVNVGVVSGGSRLNVIPDTARARIDFRVKSNQEANRLIRIIEKPVPVTEGISISVKGHLNRPPMEKTDSTAILFERVKEAGRKVGLLLEESHVGGGSDGNFTAALGIPTIDGLGCFGDGAHALHEHIFLDQMIVRTAMLSHLIGDL